MGTGLWGTARARLGAAARIWWDALSSGRFFTAWSVLSALLLVVVVLPPYYESDEFIDIVRAQLVSTVVAVTVGSVLVAAAMLERRLARRTVRGVVVVAAVAIFAILRPFVNDLLGADWFDAPAGGQPLPRVVTNLVAWFTVLSLVAVATVRYAGSAEVTHRLSDALETLSAARQRALAYENTSREVLVAGVAHLRRRLDELLGAPLDFDRVRAFSNEVRAVSHAALDQSERDVSALLTDGAGFADAEAVRPSARVPFLARLRPPPVMFVGMLFLIGSAPFVVIAGGWPLFVLAVLAEPPLTLAADLASRRVHRARSARERGRVLVIAWTLVGIVITVLGLVLLPGFNVVALTPVLTVPGLAIACALSAHALHRSETQSRRLSRVLRDIVAETATRITGTREPLRRSADLLHGRVQGRCVVLAATVDEELAGPADVEAFRRDVSAALDEVAASLSPEAVASVGSDLDQMLVIWSRVIEMRSDIDDAARSLLADAVVSRRVAAIVNEGFVNAVKHSPARVAVVRVDDVSTGSIGRLRVRVITRGSLAAPSSRAGGLGIVGLGPSTSLYESDGNVVLESVVVTVEPAVAA